MAVRISFLQGFHTGLNGILRVQDQVFKTQEQVSSGRRVVTPADDPVASARIIQVNQELSQVGQYIDNTDAVENRLNLAENQLTQLNEIYIRLKELTISTGNISYDQVQRQAVASEMDTRLAELVDLGNTRDVNGEYIFAGFQGGAVPFVQQANGQFAYNGDQGQRFVQIASTTSVAISDNGKKILMDVAAPNNRFDVVTNPNNTGAAVFTSGAVSNQATYDASYPLDYVVEFSSPTTYFVRDENGAIILPDPQPYTSGTPISFNGADVTITGVPAAGDTFLVNSTANLDILTATYNFSEQLKVLTNSPADLATLDTLRDDMLTSISNAQANLNKVVAEIGARQNTVESVRNLHSGVEVVNQEVLSELRDLDYAEAISRLSLETFTLEAAQQTFSRVSNLSLFNFL